MTKKRRLGPGDPVTFKIPISATTEEINLLNEWRDHKLLAKKIMEKVEEEVRLNQEKKLVLPLSRELTPKEQERLSIPEVQMMLGNLCLALLKQEVPTLPQMSNEQPAQKQTQEVKTEMSQEWEVPEEIDDLIDDLLDDL
jgi:hypothetical protein